GFMATSALADLAARELTAVEQRINSGSGIYRVAVGSSTSIEIASLVEIARPVLERFEATDIVYVESIEYSYSNCSTIALVNDRPPYLFVYDVDGQAMAPERSHSIALPCVGNQVVGELWGLETRGTVRQAWGDGLVMPPEYRELVLESSM